MRALLRSDKLPQSVLVGGLVTASCAPYVLWSPLPAGHWLVGILFSVSTVLWQMHQAWTPHRVRTTAISEWLFNRRFHYLLLVYAPIIILQIVWLDDWTAERIPEFRPATMQAFLITFPWVIVFQSLFFVVAVYAVSSRVFPMGPNNMVPIVMIVMLHQGVVYAQGVPVVLVLYTGLHAAFAGLIYDTGGILGLLCFAVLSYSRFLVFIAMG